MDEPAGPAGVPGEATPAGPVRYGASEEGRVGTPLRIGRQGEAAAGLDTMQRATAYAQTANSAD